MGDDDDVDDLRISAGTRAVMTEDFRSFDQSLEAWIFPELGRHHFLPNPF
jgi:hypothetical protein